jgi:hypothetical protein
VFPLPLSGICRSFFPVFDFDLVVGLLLGDFSLAISLLLGWLNVAGAAH